MTQQSMTKYTCQRMKNNEKFLIQHLQHIEIIELINDAIDYMPIGVKDTRTAIKSSKFFYLHQILLPSSYAVYIHLLTGNLPACFRELRFLYESLAFCYYAEKNYPDEEFFIEQIKKLGKQKDLSKTKLTKNLGKDFGMKSEIDPIYGQLSENWVHIGGFAEKIANITIDSQLPSWCWILPIELDDNDLSVIRELNNNVSVFRKILEKTNAPNK